MESMNVYRRYLIHTFLHKFTENLFWAFGALLLFSKTQSIFDVLLYELVTVVVGLFLKSVGYPFMTWIIRVWGLVSSMTFGLILKATTLAGIFYLISDHPYFLAYFLLLGSIEKVGNTFYVTGANSVLFSVLGDSAVPGRSSAHVTIIQTISALLATLAGLYLNIAGSFLSAFLLGGAMLLASTIPLFGIPTYPIPKVSFLKNLKKVPRGTFLANVNPDHTLRVTAVPLIIYFVSASLNNSVSIAAAIAIAVIILSYVMGWLKDHRQNWLMWCALVVAILAWEAYGFVATPIGFVIPGIVIGVSTSIISIGREARMGRELLNDGNILGGTLAIEFARGIGTFIGAALILGTFLFFRTLPQQLLMIGGIFLIPKTLYAVGLIQDRKK